MPAISRVDASRLARWWRNIDRVTLSCVGILIAFGYILMLAASPAVAVRIGASREMFILKQVVFLAFSGMTVLAVSTLSTKGVKRLGLIGGVIALAATALTLVHGVEIKGARRWIALPLMSVQPSEFLKPCFAVVTAWLLAERRRHRLFGRVPFPGLPIALGCFAVILLLLKSQPDIGMLSVVTMVFMTQLFVDGLPLLFVGLGVGAMVGAFGAAFVAFPHVRSRVERFLHPNIGDHYQIDTALRAFGNGGLLGRGPGEGRVKDLLPDAHADFVFAVAGEEYGLLICLGIIAVFLVIVLRTLLKLMREDDPFIITACTGLVAGFGLQAFINMGSTLHLIPTKGMTLPLISYGGSSAISVALTLGMVLALTRHRVTASSISQRFEEEEFLDGQRWNDQHWRARQDLA
ncbi:FtsW/RodA/SpoVE family cell cycle protein [Acidomonas methanolica]|uniref:Probable peptidoglycan glycosyltransferase FtsW n=1 Tax=Acidomonas methanolica NBRC 104435 TaxID=1231351 RepID=A0A023D6H4_ACIMT|nr:putative peptidoglycan glycosyltransferase FtsW [Acidomonas methanolica]MBU2654373.1 putative lipid II flippase FtsW [Acidomonas methanolica]TCS28461.1 cell division protein FtsW [Acidomonas methanolica]GAJ29674.1 cell division protein FtsW [Acidomonas methanolica NBRC 104435]GBQ60101.1 cell division protein FtsW [Acidomonas methanolica]GEK99601.1 cell division protein FtsW [Acidomonas methanolica NBRC 104435]